MNALVVFDSQFGTTERVARAIATRLESAGPVRLVSASDSPGIDLTGLDLLIVGGPTQWHGPRRALRAWIDAAPPVALRGLAIATFDTRLHWPAFLSGSAARTTAKSLQRKGARLVAPPESFFWNGKEGLVAGELARATAWAESLVLKLGVGSAAADPVNQVS